jgi:hypothetical protein
MAIITTTLMTAIMVMMIMMRMTIAARKISTITTDRFVISQNLSVIVDETFQT